MPSFLVCSSVSNSEQFPPRGSSKVRLDINLEYTTTTTELLQLHLHADEHGLVILFSLK